ncbi:MAG: outer membrane lipoprotein chaperone LolA [Gammaproteobacteria bacterium]
MKFAMITLLASFFFASAMAATAAQTPASRLDAMLAQTKTFTAEFTETVENANAVTVKHSSGTVAIAKPGRFRWDYKKPYQQVIVADGKQLWTYDPSLEQATVRDEPQALASGPAALLAGTARVEENFKVSDAGRAQGLEWLKLVPKSHDTDYKAIQIGVTGKGGIRAIRLDSELDQTTRINFSHVKRNAAVNPSRFRFKPPPGTDVVHQSSGTTTTGAP